MLASLVGNLDVPNLLLVRNGKSAACDIFMHLVFSSFVDSPSTIHRAYDSAITRLK